MVNEIVKRKWATIDNGALSIMHTIRENNTKQTLTDMHMQITKRRNYNFKFPSCTLQTFKCLHKIL